MTSDIDLHPEWRFMDGLRGYKATEYIRARDPWRTFFGLAALILIPTAFISLGNGYNTEACLANLSGLISGMIYWAKNENADWVDAQ
jgi:hypothetical protein